MKMDQNDSIFGICSSRSSLAKNNPTVSISEQGKNKIIKFPNCLYGLRC